MHIILYQPGAHGDLVSSVIDSTDYIIGADRIIANPSRQIHINLNNVQYNYRKTEYEQVDLQIEKLEEKYNAISSHLFDYFFNRNHNFILIDSSDIGITERCARRAEKLTNGLHVNSDEKINRYRQHILHAKTKTDKVISYDDIVEGRLIPTIRQWIDTPLNENIYQRFMRNVLPNNIKNYSFW